MSNIYVTRWKTNAFKDKLNDALRLLTNKLSHDKATEIFGIVNDRIDLRGIVVKGFKNDKKLIAPKKLENIDFSYCNFSRTYWNKLSINNCLFDKVNYSSSEFSGCLIFDSIFFETNLSNCSIQSNPILPTSKTGIIADCIFEECDFSKSNFGMPEIRKCKIL